jgi:hypothetical protein
MFTLILFLIPTLAILSALYLYQHTGKREILKFDLVQFVYAFVLTPIMYVWMKSFLFAFLVQDLNLHFSATEIFIADTVYTVIFLYIFAFVIIHSLTKSFQLKRVRDPFYDIFQHSEFFHMLTSHVPLYVGGVLLFSILSTINVFIPFTQVSSMIGLYVALVSGFLFGIIVYIAILLTDDDFEIKYPRFEMFIELTYIFVFIYNVGLYFVFRPEFDLGHVMYWFLVMSLTGFIIGSFILERSQKTVKFFKRFHYKKPVMMK